jgi:hypothetical protein
MQIPAGQAAIGSRLEFRRKGNLWLMDGVVTVTDLRDGTQYPFRVWSKYASLP